MRNHDPYSDSPFCDVATDSHCRTQFGLLGESQSPLINAILGVTYNGGLTATDALSCHQFGTCQIDFDFASASLWQGPQEGAPRFEIAGTAIPEPESIWLLGAGLAIIGVTRRLRKKLST